MNDKRKGLAQHERLRKKYRSSTHYILSALVPYTEANLKLSFKPNQFFNDLEKLSSHHYTKAALRNSYYRAVRRGLVEVSGNSRPYRTKKAELLLQRYEPQQLTGDVCVMVIFDIPESERYLRQKLRALLRELKFTFVQQSVWKTNYDVSQYLKEYLQEEGVDKDWVQVYESVRIS